jgi:hypothetical protein
MQLSNSERFNLEYNTFKEKISNIGDESVRKNLNELLTRLVAEVKAIDMYHQDLAMATKMPNNNVDHRSNLLSIRKQINLLLSQYEESASR